MIKLLCKTLLLLLPFALFYSTIAVIDPYNYFGGSRFIEDTIKLTKVNAETSLLSTRHALWKLSEFRRTPRPNVIIGDSRVFRLDYSYIKSVSGKDYYNFGIPGGNVRSAVDSFWYAARCGRLNEVYLALSFHTFNRFSVYDIMMPAEEVVENPISYVTNHSIVEGSWDLLRGKFVRPLQEKPKKDGRGDRWQQILQDPLYSKTYSYPDGYLEELRTIASYCRRNGILLRFIIFPTHVELQNRYSELGLDEYRNRFINDLAHLGKVYNFDYNNEVTRNRENYSDPFHCKAQVNKMLINEIWGSDNNSRKHYR